MPNVYVILESAAALLLVVLLYANIFEIKQNSRKRDLFTMLLVLSLIIVIVDCITYIDFHWENALVLFWILNALTYILPCFHMAAFIRYIYYFINEKNETNRIPFIAVFLFSALVGVATFIFAATGSLFSIDGGIYETGPLDTVYYILYFIIFILCFALIIMNKNKLGWHDLIAASLFILFPIISMILSIAEIGIDLGIPLLGIDMLVIFILLQSENEKKLFKSSNMDEMTGLFNRRSYEDDMMLYPDVPPEEDFIYACVDVNGLKVVNDTLGHAAGDELLIGAASCLKQSLGNYGKVYRVGGDEFVVMFFADQEKFKFLIEDIVNVTANWSGKLVDSVSISIGYASKHEFPNKTVKEMSLIAEKRMYKEKELYYSNKGIDRRGENEAYKVLQSLYTKILKINVTKDNFNIIKVDSAEQTANMGYSHKISEWLKGFALSGNVHKDDLDTYLKQTDLEYLKNYFKSNKASLTISYRRKYGDAFKSVEMEIAPANDYKDSNQSLFLYVKKVDK